LIGEHLLLSLCQLFLQLLEALELVLNRLLLHERLHLLVFNLLFRPSTF
jgi:hypothetical protein